jgi:hypothetical protein
VLLSGAGEKVFKMNLWSFNFGNETGRVEAEEFYRDAWRRRYSTAPHAKPGGPLFMDRVECPACHASFYVWEKVNDFRCECGVNLRRRV